MAIINYDNTAGDTRLWSASNTGTSGNTITFQYNPAGGGCNESKKHDNQEKALYHGLKSAYRMSRQADGEYGTPLGTDPPYETAARIAAQVACAYFATTDDAYTREASHEYIEENYAADPSIREKFLPNNDYRSLSERVGADEFRDAIDQAWSQIDDKGGHYDAARTALAAAETFLGRRFETP